MRKKTEKMKKHTTIEETESLYKVICDGEEMLSIEYDELIDKWHITSVPFKMDEIWDYRKSQKNEVIMKAMLLTKKNCEDNIWAYKAGFVQDIGNIVSLLFVAFDLICNPKFGDVIGCIIFLFMAFLSLLLGIQRRKAIHIIPFVLWVFCAVLRLNTIFSNIP